MEDQRSRCKSAITHAESVEAHSSFLLHQLMESEEDEERVRNAGEKEGEQEDENKSEELAQGEARISARKSEEEAKACEMHASLSLSLFHPF